MTSADERQRPSEPPPVAGDEGAEREPVDVQIARLEASAGAEARAKARGAGLGILALGLPILLGGLLMARFSDPGTGGEVLYGRVARAEGPGAPVEEGARCTAFRGHLRGEQAPRTNSELGVVCEGQLVYGSERSGSIPCEVEDAEIRRCTDEGFARDDGDPKLAFDPGRGVIDVEEPDWSLHIELTMAPEDARE